MRVLGSILAVTLFVIAALGSGCGESSARESFGTKTAGDPVAESKINFDKLIAAAKSGNSDEAKKYFVKDELDGMDDDTFSSQFSYLVALEGVTGKIEGDKVIYMKKIESDGGGSYMTIKIAMTEEDGEWKVSKK